jgi:hypothetical protein
MGHLKLSSAEKRGLFAKFLILVTDCHSQEMGQLRVAEIEADAQLISGTRCPAFPDQFRWFGLATLLVVHDLAVEHDPTYGWLKEARIDQA